MNANCDFNSGCILNYVPWALAASWFVGFVAILATRSRRLARRKLFLSLGVLFCLLAITGSYFHTGAVAEVLSCMALAVFFSMIVAIKKNR
jgi:CHASE2 domain-containing sensor protein